MLAEMERLKAADAAAAAQKLVVARQLVEEVAASNALLIQRRQDAAEAEARENARIAAYLAQKDLRDQVGGPPPSPASFPAFTAQHRCARNSRNGEPRTCERSRSETEPSNVYSIGGAGVTGSRERVSRSNERERRERLWACVGGFGLSRMKITGKEERKKER